MKADGAESRNVQIFSNGHLVSRQSDYIIYSVEAEHIDKVVETYGPCKTFPYAPYSAMWEG